MNKSNFLKWLLIFFLFLSAFIDIYSTISHKNFIVLESNLLFNFMNNIFILVVIKLLICGFLALVLFKLNFLNTNNFSKFFYIHFIVLFIILQTVAGINNIKIKQDVTTLINDKYSTNYTLSEVPSNIIEENVDTSDNTQTKFYLLFIFQKIYFPLFLALISFWFFDNIYLNKKDEEITNSDWKVIFNK